MAGTINDIGNLKFYTAKGLEIPMQKSYVLTWELIPGDLASKYILSPLKGYFIGDIDSSINIKAESFETGFINNGEVYARYAEQEGIDENGLPIFAYDSSNSSTSNASIYNYLDRVVLDDDNKVKVSINIKNEVYSHTFLIQDIFNLLDITQLEDPEEYASEYITSKTIYTGENISVETIDEDTEESISEEQCEYYKLFGLKKIDLRLQESVPFILTVFEDNISNIGIHFPFVRYAGDFYQEKVSSDFIATDTILVLEECIDPSTGKYYYSQPYINSDVPYSLVFLPLTDGELKIIDKASEYEIQYAEEAAFSLANGNTEPNGIPEPFAFPIAFKADVEGAYQNLLGIYLRTKDIINDKDNVFFMGALSVKSEVEGEDERFRTLLTNFGVPDPAYYSNIFAELDYLEEGKDYTLINKKSKELMLTYDLIFSYVGTYKALIRAIKFLGYQDIIFKEWYSIKDTNDKLTDVAVLVFDSSNGTFLKQKLADYGISIEDFNNYNKLNRISMIYHINERSEDVEKIDVVNVSINSETGEKEITGNYIFTSEVPLTKPVFIYRNTEILAKLFAVKQWLEQHIIGVGAYIADITGEGIYFGWQKTLGYQTLHHLNDFSQEQYYTPDVKAIGEYKHGYGSTISCTFNELNNAVRFIDYDETQINAFAKLEIPINLSTNEGQTINASTLVVSNSIEAPVLGDEYEFDLVVRPDSGTLYEWSASTPLMLILDGKAKFLANENYAYLDNPIITLENANIHTAYGDWRSNIKWSIREVIDTETGNSKYKLLNTDLFLQTSSQKILDEYIVLEPIDNEGINPYIMFTDQNKWGMPAFVIHGYKFANVEYDSSADASIYSMINSSIDDTTEYILEIERGDMLFRDNDEFHCGCQVSFDSKLELFNSGNYATKINILPTYTYHSDRVPFVRLNYDGYDISINGSTGHVNGIIEDASTCIDCSTEMSNISTNINTVINDSYDDILLDISLFNAGRKIKNNVAYNEAVNFINSSLNFQDSIDEFVSVSQVSKQQEILDTTLEEIISRNYTFNSSIDVSVFRLGSYDLISRSFDKYNNIFPAKYDNSINVTTAPIAIDIISSVPSSGNKETFYRYNMDGILLDASLLLDISTKYDKKINFPKTLHSYDINYNLENNFAEFDNILNAFDTPKNNDIAVFDTLNERVVNLTQSDDNTTILHMLDGNPNKIGLYVNAQNKTVSIHVYEYATKSIIYSLMDCHVVDCSLGTENIDICYNSTSYITIDNIDINDASIISKYIYDDFNYKVVVLNNTEYLIDIDTTDASNNMQFFNFDYDKKETYIGIKKSIADGPVFNLEDVVKVRYYMDVSVYVGDPSVGEITKDGKIINETAYRIINVENSSYIDAKTEETGECINYTLNGLLNTNLLENENVHAVITYAAECPVRYSTKVIGNANEYNHVIGYDNYSVLHEEMQFNTKQLFLNDYIDDTYGLEITDYDSFNGEKYWLDFSEYTGNLDALSLYYYHQFPITVDKGSTVIFKMHDENDSLSGYIKNWKVSVFSVDELVNIPENINTDAKETLFRSTNEILTLKPYMLGSHDIELTCTDIFGNRIVNKGEGLLYVKKL